MTKYSGIICNNCYRKLTQKETSIYDYLWQHSGDMYCNRCRDCPDDCREKPCRLKQHEAEKIVTRIIARRQQENVSLFDLDEKAVARLKNTGVTDGLAFWDHPTYTQERESYWRFFQWPHRDVWYLEWGNLKDKRPYHLYSEGMLKYIEKRDGKIYSKRSNRLLWTDEENLVNI